MSNYINRDDVINAIRNEVQAQISRMGMHQLHIVDMLKVEDAVNNIPIADVRPVTHERWKAFDFHTVACSGCGFTVDIMAVPSYVLHHLYHCPNCGADMQKKGGEEDV